jgi:hypothetical protein
MRSRRRGRWRRTDLSASPKRCTGETEGVGVSPWGPPSGSDGSGLQGRILAVALSPPPAGSHVAGPTRHNAVFVRVSEQGSTIVPRGCPSRAAASSTRPIMAACRLPARSDMPHPPSDPSTRKALGVGWSIGWAIFVPNPVWTLATSVATGGDCDEQNVLRLARMPMAE